MRLFLSKTRRSIQKSGVIALSLCALLSGTVANSADEPKQGLLNKLLAPGPLMELHKELEGSKCLECHVAGGGLPDSKCNDCHKEIKAQVVKKAGYHGTMKKACISCHSDHKGRNYDSTFVDQKKFDHLQTGFSLEGKHSQLKCAECHNKKRFEEFKNPAVVRPNDPHYLGLTVSCVSCHKKDDVHFYKDEWAKKDCGFCHGPVSWKKDLKFSHEKDAHYALRGKHAEITCAKCHVPDKNKPSIYHWETLKKDACLACHEDQHKGKIGTKLSGGQNCTKCHSEKEWKIPEFDHSVTGYKLRGKHAEIECKDCHKQADPKLPVKNFIFTGLKQECLSCHKSPHGFTDKPSKKLGNLNTCTQCHREDSWKNTPQWNHNTQTRYAIEGKHIGVKCEKCHVLQPVAIQNKKKDLRLYLWPELLTKTCENCHESPHKKTFTPEFLKKRCTECHTDQGWKIQSKTGKFDHSTTRFKLTGVHITTTCAECHEVNKKQVFKFAHFEQQFCIDCHENVHTKQFHQNYSNQSCAECHSTTNFTERRSIDHDKTRFKLTGKHVPLKCEKCHVPGPELFPLQKGQKDAHHKGQFIWKEVQVQFCVECHKNPHGGQFKESTQKKSCAVCHSTQSFEKRPPFDHASTGYPLRGKHEKVACEKCHTPTKDVFSEAPHHMKGKYLFPEMASKNCAACHKDVHEGRYGKNCMQCHNEKDWKDGAQDFHKGFNLTGVHFTLQCIECHKDGRKVAGQSQMCIACHKKDDIHRGSLPDCGQCHEQHFWEETWFRHSLTSFPLIGAHRTIDCNECHRNNQYKGLTSSCANCHLSQAPKAASGKTPNHLVAPILGQQCSNCHNQFSFY